LDDINGKTALRLITIDASQKMYNGPTLLQYIRLSGYVLEPLGKLISKKIFIFW